MVCIKKFYVQLSMLLEAGHFIELATGSGGALSDSV